MRVSALSAITLSLGFAGVSSALTWANTKYLIVFGDSYTTTGFNISAGVNSTDPGWTASDGLNWVQYLSGTFNINPVRTFNLAYGGAVTSNKLITPYLPTVISLDSQTQEFVEYLAPKPAGAQWSSDNTLFAIWIGINDVGNSWYWTNVTQAGWHSTVMNTYFDQVQTMYQHGARNFLFLTVPPIDRAPLFIEQGTTSTTAVAASIKDYNSQLTQRAKQFTRSHPGSSAVVYDTSKVFNTLLNNADSLGFVNVTGYATAYENGTPSQTYQASGFAPVSSFFWLNSLHPLYTVHYSLAHAISTVLAALS